MAGATSYADANLHLARCPHCRIANPLLSAIHSFDTATSANSNRRRWRVYVCSTCGGGVLGAALSIPGAPISEIIPKPETLDEGLPEKAAAFLRQAVESMHAPSGAIMLCASSVDAMLKD